MFEASHGFDYLVTLPPPTPNGGLHVGHMAGPFLAADMFTKAMQAEGRSVYVLSYSDTNQSYVRATAEKQGQDPADLASRWTRDILETLAAFSCQVDRYFEPNETSNAFVRTSVLALYEAGGLKNKEYPFFYSPARGAFLDEAGVSGHCPNCLDDCKCGICEACGFLTRADTLLNPRATNDPGERIELKKLPVLVLELEAWRDQIRAFHTFTDRTRPKYRWLVDDALSARLPDFPVTVPGDWGIRVNHPDAPDQVVNAWPEIALDFVFGYQQVIPEGHEVPRIVNFFGYDNSYFYAIVHVALLHAMGLNRYLPHATVINEFYNLENAKFSTSRGHLVWARDLAASYPADLIRFYAALSAPGFEQGNFSDGDMRAIIERRLLTPYRHIAAVVNGSGNAAGDGISDTVRTMAEVMSSRVANNFRLERFNLRHAAEDALRALAAIEDCLDRPGLTRSEAVFLVERWAASVAPLMPEIARRLRDALADGSKRAEIPSELPHDTTQSASPEEEETYA